MTSATNDLANLPARLGPMPVPPRLVTPTTTPKSASRTRWENREPTEATYTPEVAARVEQLRHEEQLKTSLTSSTSPPCPPVTITPLDHVVAPMVEPKDDKPESRIEVRQFDLPFEGTRELGLVEIRVDLSIQMRAQIDTAIVEEYAGSMSSGVKFPPVIVFADGETYRLADGFHRVEAAKRTGLEVITAEVKSGGRPEALWYALGANAHHGLRRTNADKRRAVEIALKEFTTLSDRAIAELCGVGNALVSEMRKQVCDSHSTAPRKGRDGKNYSTARSPRNRKVKEAAQMAGCSQIHEPDTASSEPLSESSRQEGSAGEVADDTGAANTAHIEPPQDTGAWAEEPRTPVTMVASSSEVSPTVPESSARSTGTSLALDLNTSTGVSKPLAVTDVETAIVDATELISVEKVEQAIGKVHARDFLSSDDPDLSAHVRRMVPQVATMLNRYAREFQKVDGRALCRALSMASTKLVICMKQSSANENQKRDSETTGVALATDGGSALVRGA
jgi:hypothetical protein